MGQCCTSLFVLFCAVASAAADGKDEPATIRVSGSSGVVAFRPDEAILVLEISNTAENPAAAEAENAKCRKALVDSIRRELEPTAGTLANIEVIGYTIAPGYRSSPTDVAGYIVQSAIRVTTDDILRIGAISQLASKNSGRLAQVEYSLKDDQQAIATVVKRATQIARSNAESMSAALEQKVLRVRSLEAAPGRFGPLAKADLSPRSMTSGTTIPTRNASLDYSVHFEATVTLTVEIGRQ